MPTGADDANTLDDHDIEALFRAHYTDLVRLATLVVDRPASAEEVVQDAFAAVLAGRARVRDPERALQYVRRAVVNGGRSRLRRRGTRRRHLEAVRSQPLPTAPGADVGALTALTRRDVLDAVAALPERQRQVVLLRYYLDCSEAEIAATLEIAPGTVKKHAHRGLAALAEALGRPEVAR